MNADSLTGAGVQAKTVTEIGPLQRFYWAVRRETWEHRSIYTVPLVVGALILAGYAIGLVSLPEKLQAAAMLDATQQQARIEEPYTLAALLLMFSTLLVGIFYSLDALYGERRDRSSLFWKSLPVSDRTTVLAKASIPIVILPLVTFIVTVAAHAVMLLLASARLMGTGLSVWSHLSVAGMLWTLFYHLLLGHGFWYAPFWGWLLLCSAWSKRLPFLWATLPPLAIGLLEKIAFNTAHFGHWLWYRFMMAPSTMSHSSESMTMASVTPGTPMQSLTNSGFWLGLVLAAAFLALATHYRRSRAPI